MSEELEKLEIDGVFYKTRLSRKWKERKQWAEPNIGEVYPHIPGTIIKIVVKPGDEVEEGDLLLILQAMKMNNNILAPVSGTIKSIDVKEGEKVTKSQMMVEIE